MSKSKFEVGKLYAYRDSPSTKTFKIVEKIGAYLVAETTGNRSRHLFDLDGKHVSANHENTHARSGWNLVLPSATVKYKVVRTDGTMSDMLTYKHGYTSFSTFVVGGFVQINNSPLEYVSGHLSLLNRLISLHNTHN